MIDIHCHILPGVDDGSRSLEESLEMARIAASEGIGTIINTSHYHTEADYVTGEPLKDIAQAFNQELEREGIDLKVLIGNELYYNDQLMKSIDSGDFFTLAGSRYVLIEFRPDKLPEDMEDIAYEFKIRGYIPIIAHVERYSDILKNPGRVEKFIDYGYLIQVNARSIRASGKDEIANFARELLRSHMVHFIATDAHRSDVRTPKLRQAYEEAAMLVGRDMADTVFHENPQKLLDNEMINIFEIRPFQKSKKKSKIVELIQKLTKKR